ncbi:hypothetical protein NKI00_19990 [Mesorhizobium sp. M0847]
MEESPKASAARFAKSNCDLAEDLPGKWTEIEEVAQESRRFFPSSMVPRERSLQ